MPSSLRPRPQFGVRCLACLAFAVMLLALSPTLRADVAPSHLADLEDDVRARVEAALAEAGDDGLVGYELLDAILRAGAYDFSSGALTILTDRRWHATVPSPGERAAMVELRRWPGDTVLSLYLLDRSADAATEVDAPPLADAVFEREPDPAQGVRLWSGVWTTDAGERPVLWIERDPAPEGPTLAGLIVPGDAGLGQEALTGMLQEIQAVFARLGVDPTVWPVMPALPRAGAVVPPLVGAVPGEGDEQADPWQVAEARDFTIGLPPGVRMRRTDGAVAPPEEIPEQRLWLRGRYRDLDGRLVAIGDATRAGYVSRLEPDEAWLAGESPPLGVPGARRESTGDFDAAVIESKGRSALAQSWKEPGFDGQWLIFRLTMKDHGVEIGLPVTSGVESESIYWIATTYRPAGQSPAPPPVDPAQRFGIKFERLSAAEKRSTKWTEGVLTVPGLRVDMPLQWYPSASLRSRDGYPVRITVSRVGDVGNVARVPAEEVGGLNLDSEEWTQGGKPKFHRASAVYRGANANALFVSPEGHAFLFEFSAPDGDTADVAKWWERMLKTVQLRREER